MKKNTTTRLRSVAFAGLFFLSSCGTIYYAPNQPNMPMVKDKGITKINSAVGFGELSTAFDLNAFHSVSNSVGILGNFSSMYLEGNELNSLDLGAGYFRAFSENSGFEIYSTVGYGKLKMIDSDWSGQYDYTRSSPVYRISLQPDFFYAGDHFEAGFGIRMHYFSFGSAASNTDYYYNSIYSYNYQTISKNHLMFEPTLKLAFGGKLVKLSLQGTYSQKMNSGYLAYDPLIISIGCTVKINHHTRSRLSTSKR